VIKLKISALALIIILYASSFLCLLSKKYANADFTPKTWIVDDDYGDTIQEAINNASDGDTVFICKGIYSENLVVNKSISLIGEDTNLTVIDGSQNGNVISITANNANLMSLTIKGSGTNLTDSAITVENSNNVTVKGNRIVENTNGISLYSSNNSTIKDNVISSNSFNGVYLYSSSGNVISNNIIVNNYGGIYLLYCSNNVVFDDSISFAEYGIYLFSSSYNAIIGNNLFFNNYGVSLTLSSNNTFYHNNLNNTVQASSDLLNIWSFSGEGNYWSDYTGRDINGDGIGDDPYVIDTNIRDENPLMGKFSSLSVAYKDKTYNFNIISNSTINKLLLEIGIETGNKILLLNITGKNGTIGFCRVWIPTELMKYPYVVLSDTEELNQVLFGSPNEPSVCLYFTYAHENSTIRIISSEAMHLYYELLADFLTLNITYNELVNVYTLLLENYTLLQESFSLLNDAYQQLLNLNMTHYELLNNYHDLNITYYTLLRAYDNLLGNYTVLQEKMPNSEQMQNIRNLMYIIAALSALYILTTVYLSKRTYSRTTAKNQISSEEKQ